jgi:hypothetical protein
MLEPDRRALLIDALRPPAGMAFDRAVGTTFTLDLTALLIAPVAFALFDLERDNSAEAEEGALRIDPIVLLEAVRRHADRIDLFCQAGEIRLPPKYQPILTQLEDSIHPASAPQGGIFHPKVWTIRFTDPESGAFHHRLLCMSRNLTFDRSWDVILQLEEEADGERSGSAGELARFVEALPRMAVKTLPGERTELIQQVADGLRGVRFAPPERCREIRFHPLGLGDGRPRLRIRGQNRVAVVSPFLSDGALQDLARGAREALLVSRQEALDVLKPETLEAYQKRFTLDPAAIVGEAGDNAGTFEHGARGNLSGLHAKLFVTELGQDAAMFVGSANATDAAFRANVEFLTELRGHRSHFGVDTLLGSPGGEALRVEQASFRDLLVPYDGPSDLVDTSPLEKAQAEMASLGHRLAAVPVTAHVPAEDEMYRLTLTSLLSLAIPAGTSVLWWPISAGKSRALAATDGAPLALDFGRVTLAWITSFFALEVRRQVEGQIASAVFIVNADLEGAPEHRRQQVLLDVLRSKHDFVRYLLLLLSDFSDVAVGGVLSSLVRNPFLAEGRGGALELPLLESMVRTLARDPGRLDHVARLVADLRTRPEGRDLLPDGFERVWDPIWTAREGLR